MTISVLFLYLVSIAAASPRALVPCSVAHPLLNAQPGVDACASAAPRTPIPPSSVNPATVARTLFLADMMSLRFDSSRTLRTAGPAARTLAGSGDGSLRRG